MSESQTYAYAACVAASCVSSLSGRECRAVQPNTCYTARHDFFLC